MLIEIYMNTSISGKIILYISIVLTMSCIDFTARNQNFNTLNVLEIEPLGIPKVY